MANILRILLSASKLAFLTSLGRENYSIVIHGHTNQARKAYWDANKRIFKLIAIMKEVYSATLLYCTIN